MGQKLFKITYSNMLAKFSGDFERSIFTKVISAKNKEDAKNRFEDIYARPYWFIDFIDEVTDD